MAKHRIDEMSSSELCWHEFKDWADDNGVSLEHKDDWESWWGCWAWAIVARNEAEEAIVDKLPMWADRIKSANDAVGCSTTYLGSARAEISAVLREMRKAEEAREKKCP